MAELDPDIIAFLDADGDAGRALVLLAAPVDTLMRLQSQFAALCQNVDFDKGLIYLAALADAQHRRRHLGKVGSFELEAARTDLLGLVQAVLYPRQREWYGPADPQEPAP